MLSVLDVYEIYDLCVLFEGDVIYCSVKWFDDEMFVCVEFVYWLFGDVIVLCW